MLINIARFMAKLPGVIVYCDLNNAECASAIKFHVHRTFSQPLISFGSGSLARWTEKQTDKQTNILILLIYRERLLTTTITQQQQ